MQVRSSPPRRSPTSIPRLSRRPWHIMRRNSILLGVVLLIALFNIFSTPSDQESKSIFVKNEIDLESVEYKDEVKQVEKEEDLYSENVLQEKGEDVVIEGENEIDKL